MFSLVPFFNTHPTVIRMSAVAKAFSNGEFQTAFPYLDEDVIWTIVGENQFVGKQAVVENCLQVEQYFSSVSTFFETLNIITDNNKVVINGTAECKRGNKRISLISACDIYEFTSENKIISVNSYCIQHK